MKLLSEIQVSLYLTQTLPYANLNLHIQNASVIFFPFSQSEGRNMWPAERGGYFLVSMFRYDLQIHVPYFQILGMLIELANNNPAERFGSFSA